MKEKNTQNFCSCILLLLFTNYYLYKKIAFFRVGCIYLFSLYLFPVMVLAQAFAHQTFCPEVVFKNLQEAQESIRKNRFRQHVARRVGTRTLFLLGS
jgi:hypothetical protein